MRRWIIAGVLCLGMAATGTALGTSAFASAPRSGDPPASHRCDGDHDRDDIGCPTVRVVRPAVAAPRVVARARLTG